MDATTPQELAKLLRTIDSESGGRSNLRLLQDGKDQSLLEFSRSDGKVYGYVRINALIQWSLDSRAE